MQMPFGRGLCEPMSREKSRGHEGSAQQRGRHWHTSRHGQPCGLAHPTWPRCQEHGNGKRCPEPRGYLVKKRCLVRAGNVAAVASQGKGSWEPELTSTRRERAEKVTWLAIFGKGS